MKRNFSTGIIALLLLKMLFFTASCANIIPPGGGPRDTLPPVLVLSSPKDSSLNFKEKKIVLTFDEYIQVDNVQENLVVSPNPTVTPIVEGKLKEVTIKLKDSLEPNTTYTLDFGKAIKDVNEGNAAKNFTYIFSTGNHLDEYSISGKVVLAETGKLDTTLVAVLYKNLADSAVLKLTPRYYARLDGKGKFTFHNLPAGSFNLFAMPNDFQKIYNDSTKTFAFLDAPVVVGDSSNKPFTLYAYQEAKEKSKGNQPAAKTDKSKTDKKENKLRLKTNLAEERLGLLTKLELSFSQKIAVLDTNLIQLTDTSFIPISKAHFTSDTSNTKFTVGYNWVENTGYRIIIPKEAVTDTAGNHLIKNDTLRFQTKKESEYGSVRLRFNDLDLSKSPVLQLVKEEKIVQSVVLNSKEWYQRLFEPGEYELHILFDRNKNGVWDAGKYSLQEKKQPEIVITLQRKLLVKQNFDADVEVYLQEQPAPAKRRNAPAVNNN